MTVVHCQHACMHSELCCHQKTRPLDVAVHDCKVNLSDLRQLEKTDFRLQRDYGHLLKIQGSQGENEELVPMKIPQLLPDSGFVSVARGFARTWRATDLAMMHSPQWL